MYLVLKSLYQKGPGFMPFCALFYEKNLIGPVKIPPARSIQKWFIDGGGGDSSFEAQMEGGTVTWIILPFM